MNLSSFIIPFLICIIGILSMLLLSKSPILSHSLNLLHSITGKSMYSLNLSLSSCADPSNLKELASSIYCSNKEDELLCDFRNLYFSSRYKEHGLFFLNEFSIISGVKSADHLKSINLSSVKNNTSLNFKIIIEISCLNLLQDHFTVLENEAILLKRFKPDNIMHVIHDDIFPIFLGYEELCKGDIHRCLSTYQLILLDDNDEGPYFEWYERFTSRPPMLKKNIHNLCVKKAVVGLPSKSIWYQYGFKTTHGPIINSHMDGITLRRFTSFVKKQFGIEDTFTPNQVVFLSRKINRKILNQSSLQNKIKDIYKKVRNQTIDVLNTDIHNNFKALISSIQAAKVLIGMHGSALIFTIFLPQESSIIELFPFGIQPNYVSSTKALCSLPLVNLNYKAWVNLNESNTRTHPEYPPLHGGIAHLSTADQKQITEVKLVPPVECCHNATYLFRMFQDTVVDESFDSLLTDFLHEGKNKISKDFHQQSIDYLLDLWYYPPPVFNITCKCTSNLLSVSWDYHSPLRQGVTFSLATSLGIAAVIDVKEFSIKSEYCSRLNPSDLLQEISIWMKTLERSKESEDTYFLCKI